MPISVTSPLISPYRKASFGIVDFESLDLDGNKKLTQCPHQVLQEKRFVTSTSLSSLRSGTQFKGHQNSGSLDYPVQIDVQSVDIARSSFSGYLQIDNLTDDYPSVTTYFESEIIGPRHGFVTGKWDADAEVDFEHWSKFPAFEKYTQNFYNDSFDYSQMDKDFIFMRWKEHFLVPDHKLKTIDGVSFTGFYYICFQVSTGRVEGVYYHPTAAEKFQRLTLEHQFSNTFGDFEFN